MLLKRLELVGIRPYEHVEATFPPGVTVIVGGNARGKTTVLEAIYRVATGSSHRVASDAPLVRHGADAGYVIAEVETDAGRRRSVHLELRPGEGSRARVDGREVRRMTEAIGVLRAVLFAPEDLALVRGQPAERRRFLDDLLAQRRPALAALRSEYERVLQQRNQLLRTARDLDGTPPTLEVWTDQLIDLGSRLTSARLAATRALSEPVAALCRELADPPEEVRMRYRSTAGFVDDGRTEPHTDRLAADLRRAFEDVAEEERRRGVSLVGPHRDDLEISVEDLPARTHASHGQAWSIALALRLATVDLLEQVGDRPVVLLDDVFAELDDHRREQLAAHCRAWPQTLVTAASARDVPLDGYRLEVRRSGEVSTLAT